MSRLYIAGEGTTEVDFAAQILKPHLEGLAKYQLQVEAPNLRGHKTYAATRKFIHNLLRGDAVVTTMIDLFKLPADFPGRSEPSENPVQRVERISERFGADIGNERFIPYLQLHEFEALILSDVARLADQYPNRKSEIEQLAKRVARFESPEHVNKLKPPSYWIREAVPEYDKPSSGVITTAAIGLETLRQRCTHFGNWLAELEQLVVR